ncbi:hypothetical protein [Aliarcobacter butzleri]|uniref:hypothetical protein n=1 Tax=Aliarcobacter butzleri TaxID=28197 RepID=UPI002B24FC04|nr:hypothetical protein [Aliarcobacter butzleri]
MLINIDDFTKITTVAHEKEFNAWKKKLTIEEFKSIEDYINKEIDDFLENGEKFVNTTILASADWKDKPYMLIYEKVTDYYEDLAALFFGLMVWYVIMNREENWGCGKYNMVKNRDIQSMTYFLLKDNIL